jgi:hypothetical protein
LNATGFWNLDAWCASRARLPLKGLKHASSGALDHRAWPSADRGALGGAADDMMIRARPARTTTFLRASITASCWRSVRVISADHQHTLAG